MGIRSNDHQLVAGKQYYDNEVQAVVSSDVIAMGAADTTPDVSGGTVFTKAGTATVTTFDNGVPGQKIHIIHSSATTFDKDTFKCGTDDIVTANGDVTSWVYDGTSWFLHNFMDVSVNLHSAGGQ